MVRCLKCGAESHTTKSGDLKVGNATVRTRKCQDVRCGLEFKTVEFPYDTSMLPILIPLVHTTKLEI